MNRFLSRTLIWSFALVLPVCAASAADVFDKPLDKKVVKLPADPDNPQNKPKRSCFYYPGFMAKEVDLGEEGAETLSITPITKAGQKPPCDAKNAGEMVVDPKDWSGYFEGVKGNFVFFTSGDGVNGGMPFAVVDAKNARKLFDETAGTELFHAIALSGDGLTMRYRRVYEASCSLYADPKGCWNKVKTATLLADTAKPECSAAYEKEMKRTPKFAEDVRKSGTVIGYEVEARYASGKLSFAPLPGRAKCWLQD